MQTAAITPDKIAVFGLGYVGLPLTRKGFGTTGPATHAATIATVQFRASSGRRTEVRGHKNNFDKEGSDLRL